MVRSVAVISLTKFNFSSDTTSSPFVATAPPLKPVLPPEGTRDSWYSRASLTIVATSSVERGNAMAAGAGSAKRVNPDRKRSEIHCLFGFAQG